MTTDETTEIYCDACGWEGEGHELSDGGHCPNCESDEYIFDIGEPGDDRFTMWL